MWNPKYGKNEPIYKTETDSQTVNRFGIAWVEVKNSLAIAGNTGDGIQSLGQEDPLKEEMATYSSILPWKIPRTEKPCRL